MPRIRVILSVTVLACCLPLSPVLGQIILVPEADAFVTRDSDARLNDNYGCNPILGLASTRGGGGVPYGTPDGARPLIRFDLTGLFPVAQVMLGLTVAGYNFHDPQPYTISIHRILEPWTEGNGNEFTPHPPGSGCDWVDPAYGVAWLGAGDGGDANNETQPDFDPIPAVTFTIAAQNVGDEVLVDVTALVNAWITGTYANHGMILRNVTDVPGVFRGIAFGTRENDSYDYPGLDGSPDFTEVQGPRLTLFGPVSVEASTWGRIKAQYRQ